MNHSQKIKLDKAAKEYAIHASKAPDKETPDWIITDFKAGAKWEREYGNSSVILNNLLNHPELLNSHFKRLIREHLNVPF